MAIAAVQSKVTNATSTAPALTFDAAPVAGNLLSVALVLDAAETPPDLAGWTKATPIIATSGPALAWYTRTAGSATGSDSFGVTVASQIWVCYGFEDSGVDSAAANGSAQNSNLVQTLATAVGAVEAGNWSRAVLGLSNTLSAGSLTFDNGYVDTEGPGGRGGHAINTAGHAAATVTANWTSAKGRRAVAQFLELVAATGATPITAAGDTATFALTAQDGTGVPGPLAVAGDVAAWTLAAQDGTAVVGPLVVAGDSAPFELQAQDGSVALGALVVTGDTAPWELVAQDGTVVSVAAIVALGDTAPWTLEPQDGAPLPGAVTVAGETATWALTAQDGSPVLGGLIVAGDTAPWLLTAQDGSVVTGAVVVIGDSAAWTLVANDGSPIVTGLLIQLGRAISTKRRETTPLTDRQGAYSTRVGGFK